jgi:hypothetical protein
MGFGLQGWTAVVLAASVTGTSTWVDGGFYRGVL